MSLISCIVFDQSLEATHIPTSTNLILKYIQYVKHKLQYCTLSALVYKNLSLIFYIYSYSIVSSQSLYVVYELKRIILSSLSLIIQD